MVYVNKSDIYKLFDEESNGVIRLHIADVDMLPATNVVEVEKVYKFLCKNWKTLKEQWLFNGECDWLKYNLKELANTKGGAE